MFKVISFLAVAIAAVSAVVVPRTASVPTTPGTVYTGGYATYYNQFGGYGACGNINPDSALIIAIQAARYDASLCGKTLSITNVNKGITIQAVVADMCPGCRNSESLDLSIGAWEAIGQSTEDGTGVPITWSLLGAAPVTTTAVPVTTTKATTTTTKAATTTVSAPATTTTASSSTCSGIAAWVSTVAYVAGNQVTYGGSLWQAKWWTEADTPGGIAGSWTQVKTC